MDTVYSLQGDTLDAIAHRLYGRTAGITEQLLQLNPHLANSVILHVGSAVQLPAQIAEPQKHLLQLWD